MLHTTMSTAPSTAPLPAQPAAGAATTRPGSGRPPAAAPLAEAEFEHRWQQVQQRDPGADGRYVFAVRSTGIFCRPSCPARTPRRANVAFFDTPALAVAAGFRACRRCHPDGPSVRERQAAAVVAACRLIESSEDRLDLPALAERVGVSPWHLHRLFRQFTGVTPREYRQAHLAARLDRTLQDSPSITDAVYDAGFGSASRFYEQADALLGMTPAARRSGGIGETIHWTVHDCTLGRVMVAATGRGVCAIELGDDDATLLKSLQGRFPRATLQPADDRFDGWLRTLLAHLDAPGTPIELPLDVRGTAFQQRVWNALRQIPAGRTASYAQVAAAIGAPTAARAVARACASNAIAVAIPCHRVVRGDGALGGYRWGENRKEALLARERAQAATDSGGADPDR